MSQACDRPVWIRSLKAIFHRSFNVVAVINLLVMTAYYMIFVTGTPYVQETYGASLSVAGLSGGIMVIGCLTGRFVSGSLLSFFGCRTILLAGLLLFSGSVASSLLSGPLPLLFLQRLVTGIAVGVVLSAAFGFLAIKLMLGVIRKANYMWFSVYLLCLSLGCFWLNALGLY